MRMPPAPETVEVDFITRGTSLAAATLPGSPSPFIAPADGVTATIP